MRLIYHPDAEAELIESARFYEQRVPSLGGEFLDAAELVIGADRFEKVICRVSAKLLHPRCIFVRLRRNGHEWPREPLRPLIVFFWASFLSLQERDRQIFFRSWAALSDSTA